MLRSISILVLLVLTNCAYLGLGPKESSKTLKIEALIQEEMKLHPYPVLQGLTTANQTQIKVVSPVADKITFKVFQNETNLEKTKVESIKAGETGYMVYTVYVNNLDKDLDYTFQILNAEDIVDQRSFRTVDLNDKNPSIGVISCMDDRLKDVQFGMWNDYLKQDPTYTFLIGDNVYADKLISTDGNIYKFNYATEENLWKRYIETFNTLSYYRAENLVPTLAIWDDHDYGYNNGDQTYPYKKGSLNIFNAFFGVTSTPKILEKLPGAGYIFNAFGQRFVFIDARSFRTEEALKGTKKESKWGSEQTQKILKALNTSMPTWLIEGDQYFGGYHRFESFETNHPNDFKKVLGELGKAKSKVFFVSGDRHLNELMKTEPTDMAYQTYELTSSAIHASVFPSPWKETPNRRQVAGKAGVYNYSIVKTKSLTPWDLVISSYGPEMKLLYSENIEIK